MALVTVSIGSNIHRNQHIAICLDALSERFGKLLISRIFESEPVGFESSRNFYNLVAAFDTEASVGELQRWCKALEYANGRRKESPKFSSRTLDIDLLTVGNACGLVDGVALPRDEIDKHAFVLRPLAELLPDQCHPVSGTRYATLWSRFSESAQARQQVLWPIDFHWRGEAISHRG